MPKPTDYRAVEAWGHILGTQKQTVAKIQKMAADEDASMEAIFKRANGEWALLPDCKHKGMRDLCYAYLEKKYGIGRTT